MMLNAFVSTPIGENHEVKIQCALKHLESAIKATESHHLAVLFKYPSVQTLMLES